MIEIKNLNKIYLKGKKNMVHALNNINLKIDDRETVNFRYKVNHKTVFHIVI